MGTYDTQTPYITSASNVPGADLDESEDNDDEDHGDLSYVAPVEDPHFVPRRNLG